MLTRDYRAEAEGCAVALAMVGRELDTSNARAAALISLIAELLPDPCENHEEGHRGCVYCEEPWPCAVERARLVVERESA